jgi:alpha-methylacyl-CoA racemase
MAEGATLLAAMNWGFKAAGLWRNERGTNVNDGGAHYYNAYACADGHCISIASAEPQFYALLRQKLELTDPAFDAQNDHRQWPELKSRLVTIFKTKTRAEWCALLEGTDVCFAPVLDWNEAPEHPHSKARSMFISVDGVLQPAPAPRFSRTPPDTPSAPRAPGADTHDALVDWGLSPAVLDAMRASGAI